MPEKSENNLIVNRRLLLQRRPGDEKVDSSHFKMVRDEIDTDNLPENQILIKVIVLSIDPTQRGWMNDRATYLPAVKIGETMRSIGAGKVIASSHPGFRQGDLVIGLLGWQDYALLDAKGVIKLPQNVPLDLALTLGGPSGLAAYFGLLEIGKPQAGETVVVSGAAGSTGSIAGQIAKLKGCKVIGIAGGKDKCEIVTGKLGFDACIDYKHENITQKLSELAPSGVNIYFDNVGEAVLDAVLLCIALKARIIACGAIATGYGAHTADNQGIKNYSMMIVKRARMEGFIILDYEAQFQEAIQTMMGWCLAGKIQCLMDTMDGLENAPMALGGLFEGKNIGKQLLRISAG